VGNLKYERVVYAIHPIQQLHPSNTAFAARAGGTGS